LLLTFPQTSSDRESSLAADSPDTGEWATLTSDYSDVRPREENPAFQKLSRYGCLHAQISRSRRGRSTKKESGSHSRATSYQTAMVSRKHEEEYKTFNQPE